MRTYLNKVQNRIRYLKYRLVLATERFRVFRRHDPTQNTPKMTSSQCCFENSVSRFFQRMPRARSPFIIWNFPIDWLLSVVSFTNKFVSVSNFSRLAPNRKVVSGAVDRVQISPSIKATRPSSGDTIDWEPSITTGCFVSGRVAHRKFWQLGTVTRNNVVFITFFDKLLF